MLTVVLTLALAITSQVVEKPKQHDSDCGLVCCFLAMQALDATTQTYSELKKQVGKVPNSGFSLDEMRGICENAGLHAQIIEIDKLSQLDKLKQEYVFIVHHNRGHYVVLGPADELSVEYFDKSGHFRVPRGKFESEMSGFVLVVAAEVLDLEAHGGVGLVRGILCVGAAILIAGLFISRRLR